MKFRDIPQMSSAKYSVDISWDYLEEWLADEKKNKSLTDFDPPYQRGYVWTDAQKTAYLEYCLKGGISGRDIYWNCPGWMYNYKGPLEIVDGKQRLSAVLDFLHNKIKVFEHYYKDFDDGLRMSEARFRFHINNLEDKRAIVKWYLDMNTGGSIHTEKDLQPAYDTLRQLEEKA